jgi:hypothetical protein
MSNRDISLDPRLLPISRRGAWMSLGWIDDPSRGPGWYLRTNRNRPLVHRTLFRLCFASEGTMRARPGVIEDEHENRIVFDGTSSVRIESRSPGRPGISVQQLQPTGERSPRGGLCL